MSNSWKDILDRAGDRNIGATLMRLARQATALHQFEQVARQTDCGSAESGRDLVVSAHPGNVRKEVNA